MKIRFGLIILSVYFFQYSCAQDFNKNKQTNKFKVQMNETEWKLKLSEEQFRVLRLKGTEPAFTGKFYHHNKNGYYVCAGCGEKLFRSDTKYDSGSGWPSFYDVVPGSITASTDYELGYARTEICCASCGGHLGHVFNDGPNPTGLRYCVNSISLDFKKE